MNNKEIYDNYKNILNIMREKNLSIIKLEILDNMQSFDAFWDLSYDGRISLIDLIFDYYVADDWFEYNLYNFIDETMRNLDEIIKNNFDEKFYWNLMDKKLIG